MNYYKLALLVSLAVSLHGTCYATTVAGHASAEGEENSVVLLHDSDGGTGQIVVTTPGGVVITSQSNSLVISPGYTQPPAAPVVTPNQPNPPATFPPGVFRYIPQHSGPPSVPSSGSGSGGGSLSQVLAGFHDPHGPDGGSPSTGGGSSGAGGDIPLSQVLAGLSGGGTTPFTTSALTGLTPPAPGVSTGISGQAENHQTDQLATTLDSQVLSFTAQSAHSLFAQGSDQSQDLVIPIQTLPLDFITWGPWVVPQSNSAFPQTYGLIYDSHTKTDMTTLPISGTADYHGALRGTAAYASTSAAIAADITMQVNFAKYTLNLSGGGISGTGSFTATSPAVTGQISYQGSLNNLPARLNGNFAGAFFGNNAVYGPLEVGAAWAMTGTVGNNAAHAAGVAVATRAGN